MSQSSTEIARQSGPEPEGGSKFKESVGARHGFDRLFAALVFAATMLGIIVLAVLLIDVAIDGIPRILQDPMGFLTGFPSSLPESAGIYPGLLGSLWLVGLTALFSIPLGIGAAIYLEEYATDNWLTRLVEINISNLAGVPSIIYGLLGLAIFVNLLGPVTNGNSILSGALTLGLLILPVIIIATREALRSIPNAVREGGYALGATRWEVIRSHLLPMALPGAITGTILALSRAVGETAPLIVVGAVGYISFAPNNPFNGYTALPIQIYNFVSQPQPEFKVELAAAGIVVLMVVLLLTNSVAIWLRNKTQRRS